MIRPAVEAAIRLRLFNLADLPQLVDLWIASWTRVMPQIDFAERRGWFEAHLAGLQAQGAAIICAETQTGHLAGFVSVDAARHYLDQLAVAPEAFGSPVARLLLAEAKRQAATHLVLHVNQDNPRALRFYEREGFVREAEDVNPRSGLKVWKMRWEPADQPASGNV
jgi:putative acetyltransferase